MEYLGYMFEALMKVCEFLQQMEYFLIISGLLLLLYAVICIIDLIKAKKEKTEVFRRSYDWYNDPRFPNRLIDVDNDVPGEDDRLRGDGK